MHWIRLPDRKIGTLIITKLTTSPASDSIFLSDAIVIQFSIKPYPIEVGAIFTSASMTWFIDDVISDNPSTPQTITQAMTLDSTNSVFKSTISKQSADSVIRFNITLTFNDGRTVDGFIRYQESRWNRLGGQSLSISSWGYTGPSDGNLAALSYHLYAPSYNKFSKRTELNLFKIEGCTMYKTPLMQILMEASGIGGTETSMTRLYINKGLFRYYMILNGGGNYWADRQSDMHNQNCLHQSTEIRKRNFKNKEEAEMKFKEIQQAYEVLSDVQEKAC